MDEILDQIFDGILDGDAEAVEALVQRALEAGGAPSTILQDCMIPAMREVGVLFEEGEYFVPEMIISARAMKAGLVLLKPLLAESGVKSVGTVIIGTVQGDLHDIGKNLVSMMLEGAGFKVVDLGIDVKTDKFIEAVKTHKPDIVALSALLTTTMPALQTTIEALGQAGVLEDTRVMVGGAPVTPEYAEQIHADGFAADASKAAELARSFISA